MTEEERDLAEDRGYALYRCPICRKTFRTDGSPECPRGCYVRAEEDDVEPEQD